MRIVLLMLLFVALPLQAEESALDTERCRIGAQAMIEHGEQAVAGSHRPELAEKRRELVDSWKRDLENGVDPCVVYGDIYKASNTF